MIRIAYSQNKIDGLEWTSYMDECLQTIVQFPEQPGDEYLAAQVMMQLIIDQLRRRPKDCLSCLETLHVQLKKIKTQMSPTLQQNSKLLHAKLTHLISTDNIASLLLYTELIIQDFALSNKASPYNLNLQRHQLLTKHLETLIQWFDLFFAIPLDVYAGITFAWWSHMAHGLKLLHRLYILDEPAWDRATVRARLDLFTLCDRLIAILNNTASGQNVFVTFAEMISSLRNGWLTEMQAMERQSQTQSPEHEERFNRSTSFMIDDDDAWLQDFLNV